MPTVYFSVSSEGYGHSSRAMALAKHWALPDVLIGTYGIALQRITRHGYPTVNVPQEIKLVGKQGSFDVGKTILQNPSRALTFNQIVIHEMDIMRRHKVAVVVADGRMAPVVAASRLELPCVVLTNQSAFYPFFAQDTALVKLLGLSFDWLMKFWLSSAEEIWIPDFPPPHTVCLYNLSEDAKVKKRTRFVGPLVRWTPEELHTLPPLPDGRKQVVVSLGGHAYRQPLFDAMLVAARQLPGIQFDVFSSFTCEHPPENVTIFGTEEECAPYFKAAHLVITQAGHSTAMELATLGTPAIVVPDTFQTEQENNARRLSELGLAKVLTYDQLALNQDGCGDRNVLVTTITAALADQFLAERAGYMAQKAAALAADPVAVQLLVDYASRLTTY
jgi:UDP-N-acetylglucosamine--N-acetylmuramyl-(pentapeptide) pyrophosphoryl-undecaprenol N-acetylglucosamine transferase